MAGFDLFARPAPRWFTIASHRPFVEDLAAGLLAALGDGGPEALADAVVLTPTRRGARALADAFVAAGGGRALLLPQIRALGDLDEGEPPFEPGELALDLPPAVTPMRRRFELARLIADHGPLFDRGLDAAALIQLADALASLLDSLQIEEIEDPGAIEGLVEGELARHWVKSAEFLSLATVKWPQRLAELGLMDVTERRTALLRALAEAWRAAPPDRVLIAAGSTGTAPATADLLRVIAEAPRGAVVLPGLDLDLAEAAWRQVGEAHPQGAMRRLLARARLERNEVLAWPARESPTEAVRGRSRRRVVNEALRPAEATADWRAQIDKLRQEGARDRVDPIAQGLEGLAMVTARTEEEAATATALLLREALETPGRTAALVTPDPALARRVSAHLARWGVAADSSAGAPLSGSPSGVLIGLVAGASSDRFDPVRLLAILKHPQVRLSREPQALFSARRTLERRGLRGPRPDGWAGLDARLALFAEARGADMEEPRALARDLRHALVLAAAPFAQGAASVRDAAEGLTLALEALCRDAHGATGPLWAGASGEAAAGLLSSLLEESAVLPRTTAGGFAALVERLCSTQVVRTGGVAHPRLRILGTIEARLIRADRLVLAGLEEGVWPRVPDADPFLSRPMRARLGLPPPERRIGLSAHDFAQAACAPDVTLIHVERRGGQPAVASRWLWRLTTLVRGADTPEQPVALERRADVLDWARSLDAPIRPPPASLQPARRPEPRPPLSVRPRQLPVTRVETWVRDPYAVYARQILGLKALDRPDALAQAAARGSAVHAAFEQLARLYPDGPPPPHAAEHFKALLIEALQAAGFGDAALTRERALAARLGDWAVRFETERRAGGPALIVEQEGSYSFTTPGGAFTVTAKADRIERHRDYAHVLDFKTGAAPSRKQIDAGFSPQLTLTAAILQAGGFTAAGPVAPGELVYVRVTGRRTPGEAHVRAGAGESADMANAALSGLVRRVLRFDDPATPYAAWAAPQFLSERGGDYDHLARLFEWHVMGQAGEGGEAEAGAAG